MAYLLRADGSGKLLRANGTGALLQAGVGSSAELAGTGVGVGSAFVSTELDVGVAATGDDSRKNEETGSFTAAALTFGHVRPSAPTGLVATAGDSEVVLDWNDHPQSGVTYRVYRSTLSPVTTADTLVGSPSASTLTDTTVVNGTTYYYAVGAVDGDGDTSASLGNEVSASPATAMPTGSIHDWQFDNATTLQDTVGTLDIPGSNISLVTFGADFVPASQGRYNLDAVANSTPIAALDKAADWTWTVVFKTRDGTNLRHIFLHRHNTNDTRINLQIRNGNFNATVYDTFAAAAVDTRAFATTGNVNTAIMVTLRWQASTNTLTLWKNDAAVTEVANTIFHTGANGIAFGDQPETTTDRTFDGVIARSVVWNRRLTDLEMADLYSAMQSFAAGRGETL